MTIGEEVDVEVDLRAEVPGRDPDRYSTRLRRYHRVLWSRPLPSGERLTLDSNLVHQGPATALRLSSDAICPTYLNWKRPAVPAEARTAVGRDLMSRFVTASGTVGAFIVFPVPDTATPRAQSINQARGIHPQVRDRFDLTLECIRRHYRGEASPLSTTLARHREFFDLFGDFAGYVSFFLLDDLVMDSTVLDLTTSSGVTAAVFDEPPFPATTARRFISYTENATAFVAGRNLRIRDLSDSAAST